jgi:hypothetical protein
MGGSLRTFPVGVNDTRNTNDYDDIIRMLDYAPSNNETCTKIENMEKCEKDAQCSICLDCIDSENTTYGGNLKCGHSFHVSCINMWFEKGKNNCPMCRTAI